MLSRGLLVLAALVLLAGCISPQSPMSWRASLDEYCATASIDWVQPEYMELAKEGATFRGPAWAEGNWKFVIEHQPDGLALTEPSLVQMWEQPRLWSVAWTESGLAGRLAPDESGTPTITFTDDAAQLRAVYKASTPEGQIKADLGNLFGHALGWTQARSDEALADLRSKEPVMFNGVIVLQYSLDLHGPFQADALVKKLVEQRAIQPNLGWDGLGVRQLESDAWSATVTIPVRHLEGGEQVFGYSILRVDAEGNVEFAHGQERVMRSDRDLWALARQATAELDWPLPAWPPYPGYTSQTQTGCPDD